MHGLPDISTVELSRTRLRLRDDLIFVPQRYNGEVFYHLEVKTTSEYFRIGYAEYVFVSLLDGRTSFAEALAVAAQTLREKSLNQTQAMSIYSWLLDNGLATFSDTDTGASGAASTFQNTKSRQSFWKQFNPLWIRLPLGRPEPLVRTLNPFVSWIFSGPAAVAVLALMTVAGMLLHSHWTRFAAASINVIAQDNWLWLLGAWVALKFFHEMGHALVCHRYGGNVREAGVILAFLTPLAYVDASTSWAFRSRWQRIHVAMAGVFVELLIASIAVIIWTQTDSLLLRHLWHNVIVMASVSTLLFNLNPLMKFDGYYVLSDLMQIPNLSSQASSAVLRQFQKTLFGDTGGAPVVIGKQKWILLAYGIAACVWRLLVSLSLLMAASVLFHGAGLILACIGVILWFGRPLWNMLTSLNRLRLQHPERLLRASLICTSVSVVATAAMTGLPAPIMTTAPGIVDFSEGQVVRPETSGFVEVVHVKNGQEVHEGDVLISLRNDDVATRHADLQQRLAQEELRLQTASGEHDSAALNVHQVNRQSLLNQLAESTKQVSGLQIRATRAGRVAGRDLHSLKGTFAVAGKELMTIGREGEKEMQISIGQRELAVSTSLVGEELKLRIGTHSVISGTLVRVNPRGSRSIPHPALAATHGGNLAVTETPSSEQSGSEDGMRLTEHRFRAIVQLQADDARMLKCGERGTASLGWPRGSLGTYLWRSAYNWFDRQLTSIASGSPI